MEAKEIQTAQPIWKAARVENDIEIRAAGPKQYTRWHGIGISITEGRSGLSSSSHLRSNIIPCVWTCTQSIAPGSTEATARMRGIDSLWIGTGDEIASNLGCLGSELLGGSSNLPNACKDRCDLNQWTDRCHRR